MDVLKKRGFAWRVEYQQRATNTKLNIIKAEVECRWTAKKNSVEGVGGTQESATTTTD